MKIKAELRKKYLQERKNLTADEVLKSTLAIIERLKANSSYLSAKNIVGFAPLHNEPNLLHLYHDLEKEGKNLLFLRLDGKEMNAHKINHPDELDMNSLFKEVTREPKDMFKKDGIQGNKESLPEPYAAIRRESDDEVDNVDRIFKHVPKFLQPPANSEIIPPEQIDLILVPALAFDHEGHRLGFGLGYYDRYLKKLSAHKIGIGFDFQVTNKLPREDHDVAINELITPSKTYIF